MTDTPILATGFIADAPGESSLFPSAGGGSAEPRVQAVYWRCIAVLFTSARITNPALELAFFSNVEPPLIDGVDLAVLLDRLGVERHLLPLTHRLPPGAATSWGNVFYFMDVFTHFAATRDRGLLLLLDSDIIVTRPLEPLMAALQQSDFGAYEVDTPTAADINGMSREQMRDAATAMFGQNGMPAHYGGEFLAARLDTWRSHAASFEALIQDACRASGPGAAIRTEEHAFSIVLGGCGARVTLANPWLKRIWTSPRYSNLAPGDEALPLWHLPAEKRYGLRDLFFDLAAAGFPAEMEPDAFRALAMKRCGLPGKTASKILRDGIWQLAAKLGLRR